MQNPIFPGRTAFHAQIHPLKGGACQQCQPREQGGQARGHIAPGGIGPKVPAGPEAHPRSQQPRGHRHAEGKPGHQAAVGIETGVIIEKEKHLHHAQHHSGSKAHAGDLQGVAHIYEFHSVIPYVRDFSNERGRKEPGLRIIAYLFRFSNRDCTRGLALPAACPRPPLSPLV